MNLESSHSMSPFPLWKRHRPPSAAVLKRTPKRSFGYVASTDAIRVRGFALTIDRDPSPQPSKSELRSSRPTRGEGGVVAQIEPTRRAAHFFLLPLWEKVARCEHREQRDG